MERKGGLGVHCAYVEAGKDKDEQLYRLNDVPDRFRNDVIRHMRSVIKRNEKLELDKNNESN